MTLQAFLDLWISTYVEPKRAANTVRAYRYALAHLSADTLTQELAMVDAMTLQREINHCAAAYSRQAQIMYVGLNAAFKRAAILRLIMDNPMAMVEKPIHETQESGYLSQAEAVAYADAAMKQPAGPLLLLMLCIGLRRNEARGLRGCDLDEDGILHIRHQRTRKGLAPLKSHSSRRDVPLPEPLRAIFSGKGDDYLVDISEKSLRKQHRKVLRTIGCEDKRVTLHGLRHTAATMAIQSGAQLVNVQQLLGHRHISLTADLYVHRAISIIRPCVDVLSGRILSHPMGEGARLEIV